MKNGYTKLYLVLILVLLFFSSSSKAQIVFEEYGSKNIWNHWYAQVSVGANALYGDISSHDHDPIKKIKYETSYGYSGSFGKWINSWIAAQLSLSGGKLRGVKNSHNSHTSFYQYTVEGVINITQLIYDYQRQTQFYGYVKLGYGLINFKAYVTNNKDEKIAKGGKICIENDEKVSEWLVPIGAGIVYNLDKNYSFFLDATYQYVNTDKLDAICTTNGTLDRYINGQLGFRYTFSVKGTRQKSRRSSSRKGLHWVN